MFRHRKLSPRAPSKLALIPTMRRTQRLFSGPSGFFAGVLRPPFASGATLPDPWPIRKILTHVGHCRFAAPESACENRRKMVLYFDSRMLLFTQSKPKTRAV